MNEIPQPDVALQRKLRRAAAHLQRQGTQYREKKLLRGDVPIATMKLPHRVAFWLGLIVISSGAFGISVLARSDNPTESRTPVRLASDDALIVDEESVVQENGNQTGEASNDGDGVDLGQTDGSPNESNAVDVGLGQSDRILNGENRFDAIPVLGEPTSFPELTTPTTSIPDEFGQVGPVISDIAVPAIVKAGSSLTFRWRAADPDLVSATGVRVGWASGIFSSCGFGELGTLESGTTRDGEWSYTCWIPSNAVSTFYSVSIWASDMLGHSSDISYTTFVVEGGNDDTSAPLYTNVSVENTVSPGGIVVIKWTLADPSGIEGAVMWVAGPTGFYNLTSEKSYANYATLVITRDCNAAGDSCELTQSVQIDPTSPAGVYTLWVSATDKLGNKVLEPSIQFDVTN